MIPESPLALEGPSRSRRRDPERQLFGEVAEQKPLPRHSEPERLTACHLDMVQRSEVCTELGAGQSPRADRTLGERQHERFEPTP